MKFAHYDPIPVGAVDGKCAYCETWTVVMYDIQLDLDFCSPECHDDWIRAERAADERGLKKATHHG